MPILVCVCVAEHLQSTHRVMSSQMEQVEFKCLAHGSVDLSQLEMDGCYLMRENTMVCYLYNNIVNKIITILW